LERLWDKNSFLVGMYCAYSPKIKRPGREPYYAENKNFNPLPNLIKNVADELQIYVKKLKMLLFDKSVNTFDE
jgi:hypothetical protein